MFLSQLELNAQNKTVHRLLGNCYELHRFVMTSFQHQQHSSVDNKQALYGARHAFAVLFRLQVDNRNGKVALLVQSQIEPEWSVETARIITRYSIKNIDNLFARLEPEMKLRFLVVANPTVKKGSSVNSTKTNGMRIPLLSETDQLQWLISKGQQHGFRLVVNETENAFPLVRIQQTMRIIGYRPTGDIHQKLTFVGVTYEGLLSISNKELFAEMLKTGLGQGKAFGCGLMSIAPIKNDQQYT